MLKPVAPEFYELHLQGKSAGRIFEQDGVPVIQAASRGGFPRRYWRAGWGHPSPARGGISALACFPDAPFCTRSFCVDSGYSSSKGMAGQLLRPTVAECRSQ